MRFVDIFIPNGSHRVLILGINESTNSLMVRFLDSIGTALTQGRPFVVNGGR